MRTPPLLAVICLLSWNSQSNASTPSALVRIACARDPQLAFCQNTDTRAKDEPVNELLPMNPKVRGVKSRVTRQDDERKEADLREKGHDSEEGFIPEREGHSRSETEDTEEHRSGKVEKEDYCDRYEQHFSFYCTGDSNDGQQEAVTKFCPSYKRACPGKGASGGSGGGGGGSTAWPADPFRDTPRRRVPVKAEESEESSEEPEVTEQELYYAELQRRFPCKPDCDKRIFPHCTAECKCDYLYPMVQRFCNPPPMPLFLNTCRLWYTGCPKYEAYHYSSQFVYSKAEKGKVLPGPQASNPNPYNIPQPLPHRSLKRETSALLPLARTKRAATDFVIPPDLPDNFEELQRKRRQRDEPVEEQEETVDVLEQVVSRKKKPSRRHRRRKAAAPVSTTPSPRELFWSLRALNNLTKDPTRLTKDLLGQGGGSDEPRPKALAPNSGTPVVSDFGGNDPTFKQFDGLTDSKGILHRPRSSSPFTKPGLWEPNPSDPHSRDPTNKYAYHVRSTGVDWLNGQMTWGAHWAVPAAGVGGTDGFSALHFPSIGNFLQIPDDYD